ncbi:MAG: tetratricopeptide repeat protein [Myxococcota bacterium]
MRSILEINPGDLAALDELASLGEQEERYDKQITALESKLKQVSEDHERKGILFEVARIWEDRIDEFDEAIDALNRVLEIDGSDQNALHALARIYEHESRWNELAHVLTRKVELCQDPQENIALRMRVAQLCEGELGDPETAIAWYRGILDFDPAQAGALSSLDRLYTGFERWSELIQIFEMQIVQAQSAEEQLSLLAKMASIYETEFSSPGDAVQCYERCFQVDPNHLASLRNLERLLRIQGEWTRLIEVLEHHIELLSETEEITALYLQIGEIYYKELSRVDKAEQIFNKARESNPNSDAALHSLGKLYERSGNWFQSLEMLQREVDAKGMEPEVIPILMRIGRINEEMLMDIGSAQNAYRRILEIDPTHAGALDAMKDMAHQANDWEGYSEYLITQAETADDDDEKTELFVEAAKFFAERREDEMSAIRFYRRALEISPQHMETNRELAEIFFRNEMWEEAGERYQIVVSALDKSKDAKDYCQKYYRLGYISEKIGDHAASLDSYRKAFEADATYLPALEGLGQALLNAKEWEEAQKVFQTILIHHRDSLTESEVVDVQAQLGEIFMALGQPERGYKQYEKALEIDPDHAPSLGALARLAQEVENWEQAYTYLSRLGDVAPGPERFEALLRMSELAMQQLGDISRAIEPLERARRLGQASVDILERLAELHIQVHQAPKAIEVLEEATGRAEDPQQLSEVNFKLAKIYEEHIKHEPLAVQKFNAALDAEPTNVKAFESIEHILGNRQEWALLEENYRAQIARSKALSPQIRLVLWRNLAELYRQVMRSLDGAIMAYEVISKLAPGNAEDLAILAELYAQKPEKHAIAIEMQHDLIGKIENPVQPIRILRKLYHTQQDFDAVLCLGGRTGLSQRCR